jgi:protein-tyrosine phosphatase
MTQVLMVCMGNICRSPMAKVVAAKYAAAAGLGVKVRFDSAGTHAQRIGERPDSRAKSVLEKRGYKLDNRRSRRIQEEDFQNFDWIFAMDCNNLLELQRLCPPQHAYKLKLFLDGVGGGNPDEILDPYYGNLAGFERVLDLCEIGARNLVKNLA